MASVLIVRANVSLQDNLSLDRLLAGAATLDGVVSVDCWSTGNGRSICKPAIELSQSRLFDCAMPCLTGKS